MSLLSQIARVSVLLLLTTKFIPAQQGVTTSGSSSANTVPRFTSGANVEGSSITQSGNDISVNGKLAVGTANQPGSVFEVHQTAGTTNSGISILNSLQPYFHGYLYSGTLPSNSLNLYFGDTTTASTYGFNIQAGSISSPSNLFTVLQNGQVGIGTSAPSANQLLEVNGNVKINGVINAAQGLNVVANGDPTSYNTLNFNSSWGPISWGATFNAANHWGTTLWSWQPDNSQNGANLAFATGNGPTVNPNGNIRMLIDSAGNIGIGTNTPQSRLDIAGNVRLSGTGANMTFPDNTVQATAWNGTTCGGDYAESVDVAGDRKRYQAGDVLTIDADAPDRFLHSTKPYSRLVAGIYSTKPGLTGRREGRTNTGEEVPMAMLGIVPTHVSAENGPIEPGDLLVTSNTEGYAMKGTDSSKMMGAVIGKAMGKLANGKGVIEVLVSLQ